ncbi:hypothetical protein ABK040_001581 [Willaertia magna]
MSHQPLPTRLDLMKTSSVASNCLKIFPLGKRQTQKVVIGDADGVMHTFSIKRGSVNTSFKSLPHIKPIKGVELFNNKAFFVYGQTVKGITKKGKEFYRLDSNISEDASGMTISVPNLWLNGQYVLYHYVDSEERGFYMSPDRINVVIPYFEEKDKTKAILGCQDRKIRIVSDSECISQFVTEGAVSSLLTTNDSIIYGTESGLVSALSLKGNTTVKTFDINGLERGIVNEMLLHDINGDGVKELIVGRNDGTLEAFSFINPTQPIRLFKKLIEESISGITAGKLVAPDGEDVLVSTFSGKVIAFTNNQYTNEDNNLLSKINILEDKKKVVGLSKAQRIQNLQKEIESSEEKLVRIKNNYVKISSEVVAVHCQYETISSFILDSKEAFYRLSLESDVHLDTIVLRADVPMEFLEASGDNNVIVSVVPVDEKKDLVSKFLSTFRFIDSCKRIDILLRTFEGKYGTLEAYVIPRLNPKISKVYSYGIKPLSLHERVHEEERPSLSIESRPMNKLLITGSFSLAEIHSWISLCIEGIPEKITEDDMVYTFQSTFQQTVLVIKLKRGEAIMESDNLTAISVIEEILTKTATDRKVKVNVSFEVNDSSFAHALTLLYPKLEFLLKLNERVKLIDALKEIQLQEEDISFLSREYKEILENSESIIEESKKQSRKLDFLNGIVIRLFHDCLKFKRRNIQNYLPTFKQMLETKSYNLEKLINAFIQIK